jgi:dihydrofolate reductase
MKSIVVAYDRNYGVGAENDLLWLRDLPADLKHFKDLTTGNAVIMGRKTYDSIGRPLPDRQNIVVSRQPLEIEGVTVVDSLQAAFDAVEDGKDAMVIGGGQIYGLALADVDRIYATEVQETFKADIFFPAIDRGVWREISREHHAADERNKYDFDYVIYDRI